MSQPLLSAYYLMPRLSLIGGYACVGGSAVYCEVLRRISPSLQS